MKAYPMAAVAACIAMPAQAAPPPASAFGRIPVVVDAAISPGGQRVAILGGTSDQRVISIATIDQPNLPVLPLGDVEAVSVTWAGDGHVLARIAYWQKGDIRTTYRFERNISISPEAKVIARLLDNDILSQYLVSQPVLGVTGDDRAMVLGLADNGRSDDRFDTRMKRKGQGGVLMSLWKVDPATGNGQLAARGAQDTDSWAVDLAGEPRVRIDIDEISHRFSLLGRPGGKGDWKPLWDGGSYESRRQYYGYSEPDDAVYLGLEGGVVKKRLADGAMEPLGKTADGPSVRLVRDPHRNTAVGIASGAERATYEWLDPEIGTAAGVLIRAFKAQEVHVEGWSRDRNRFIARVAGPASPGVWYLYDRGRKEISPMGEEYPELKGAALGTTRWITYKARDGLEIPGYLTLPPGAQPGARLPLVVYPHGGPRSRDTYDFDYVAQFLATRGYAVLQPQFRGSWGFGDAFEKAGQAEWGGKMQTDLLDGVAALAAAGDIDPKRVCIIGASFGGYAALAGAALHPDAYRCAASIAGISDLGQLLIEEARTQGRDGANIDELKVELGAASSEKLAAWSPARHAAAVQAPVLLIHGDRDTVVLPTQSQLMAERLKAAGKPYEFVLLEGENHYLTRSASRTRTLEALEAFLGKHLPVN